MSGGEEEKRGGKEMVKRREGKVKRGALSEGEGKEGLDQQDV